MRSELRFALWLGTLSLIWLMDGYMVVREQVVIVAILTVGAVLSVAALSYEIGKRDNS